MHAFLAAEKQANILACVASTSAVVSLAIQDYLNIWEWSVLAAGRCNAHISCWKTC